MSDPNRKGCSYSEKPNDSDTIYRQDALEALRTCYETERIDYTNGGEYINYDQAVHEVEQAPSAEPGQKKMSNKEWVDFLSEQFTVSRTSAREMLHGLMKWKAEDNFKKQFSGGRNEKG